MNVKMEATGCRDMKRVIINGVYSGLLMRCTSGRWGLFGKDEKKLINKSFAYPRTAKVYIVNYMGEVFCND